MPSPFEQRTLLDELDARQNEVLSQLDDLNQRIESLLSEWLAGRNGAAGEEAPSPAG
jgi:hypothetical protein